MAVPEFILDADITLDPSLLREVPETKPQCSVHDWNAATAWACGSASPNASNVGGRTRTRSILVGCCKPQDDRTGGHGQDAPADGGRTRRHAGRARHPERASHGRSRPIFSALDADKHRLSDFADAPINAQAIGSAWRGSRPQSADGTEGSLDARDRSRRMPFGASAFLAGMDVCVRDRSALSHAAQSDPARREVVAHTEVDRA